MNNDFTAGLRRILRPAWDSIWDTFVAYSPPPQPVIVWNLIPARLGRLGDWLRTDMAFWLAVVGVFGIGFAAGSPLGTSAVVFAAAIVAPVLAARHSPLVGWRVAAAVSVVTTIAYAPVETDGIAGVIVIGLSLYTLYIALSYRRDIALWATGVTVVVVAEVLDTDLGIVVILGALLAILADALRSRQATAAALGDERERTDVERARRVGAEERARIARELHDVVAHHMSMVAVRAETAPYRIDDLSEEARTEFTEISAAARESLNEIRGLLTILRSEEAPLVPEPGLDEAGALVEAVRRAGTEVALSISGDRRRLPATVELAAYRILQESLSNVTRHAPGESARVWIGYGDDSLDLMVANPCSEDVGDAGHGLTGMEERAAAVGGTVEARRRLDGTFVVEASLPVAP